MSKLIFDKELCIKDAVALGVNPDEHMKWINLCEGKEVIDGSVVGTIFVADPAWCREETDDEHTDVPDDGE